MDEWWINEKKGRERGGGCNLFKNLIIIIKFRFSSLLQGEAVPSQLLPSQPIPSHLSTNSPHHTFDSPTPHLQKFLNFSVFQALPIKYSNERQCSSVSRRIIILLLPPPWNHTWGWLWWGGFDSFLTSFSPPACCSLTFESRFTTTFTNVMTVGRC